MSEQKMREALEQIAHLCEIPFAHTKGDADVIYQIAREALSQRDAQEPVAWAAQNTRTGKFNYIWHQQDDVDGWIRLEHQSQDQMTFRKVALYASPPPAQVPSEWVEFAQLVISTHEEGGWPSAVVVLAKNLLAKQEGK